MSWCQKTVCLLLFFWWTHIKLSGISDRSVCICDIHLILFLIIVRCSVIYEISKNYTCILFKYSIAKAILFLLVIISLCVHCKINVWSCLSCCFLKTSEPFHKFWSIVWKTEYFMMRNMLNYVWENNINLYRVFGDQPRSVFSSF